jgi:SAM-dependent methyltransferase
MPMEVDLVLNRLKGHAIEEDTPYDVDPDSFMRAAGFEKTSIIAPVLREMFELVVNHGKFKVGDDRVLDIGCGPMLLALPFLTQGIAVDGIDTSPNMLLTAAKTLQGSKITVRGTPVKVNVHSRTIQSSDDVQPEYAFAMMNFTHNTAKDFESLSSLFKLAAASMKVGGRLAIVATHPEYLHVPHAAYECEVGANDNLRDGDKYKTKIFGYNNDILFSVDDYYWSTGSVIKAAESADLSLISADSIDDKDSMLRPASNLPAYQAMLFKKSYPQTEPILS